MLVLIIKFIHLILVIGLTLSIFINNLRIKQLSLVFLIYILAQYITNYGKCGLTELEYIFMKTEYKQGFLYRLINPVITMDEIYFNNYLFLIHIGWIVVLIYQIKLY